MGAGLLACGLSGCACGRLGLADRRLQPARYARGFVVHVAHAGEQQRPQPFRGYLPKQQRRISTREGDTAMTIANVGGTSATFERISARDGYSPMLFGLTSAPRRVLMAALLVVALAGAGGCVSRPPTVAHVHLGHAITGVHV